MQATDNGFVTEDTKKNRVPDPTTIFPKPPPPAVPAPAHPAAQQLVSAHTYQIQKNLMTYPDQMHQDYPVVTSYLGASGKISHQASQRIGVGFSSGAYGYLLQQNSSYLRPGSGDLMALRAAAVMEADNRKAAAMHYAANAQQTPPGEVPGGISRGDVNSLFPGIHYISGQGLRHVVENWWFKHPTATRKEAMNYANSVIQGHALSNMQTQYEIIGNRVRQLGDPASMVMPGTNKFAWIAPSDIAKWNREAAQHVLDIQGHPQLAGAGTTVWVYRGASAPGQAPSPGRGAGAHPISIPEGTVMSYTVQGVKIIMPAPTHNDVQIILPNNNGNVMNQNNVRLAITLANDVWGGIHPINFYYEAHGVLQHIVRGFDIFATGLNYLAHPGTAYPSGVGPGTAAGGAPTTITAGMEGAPIRTGIGGVDQVLFHDTLGSIMNAMFAPFNYVKAGGTTATQYVGEHTHNLPGIIGAPIRQTTRAVADVSEVGASLLGGGELGTAKGLFMAGTNLAFNAFPRQMNEMLTGPVQAGMKTIGINPNTPGGQMISDVLTTAIQIFALHEVERGFRLNKLAKTSTPEMMQWDVARSYGPLIGGHLLQMLKSFHNTDSWSHFNYSRYGRDTWNTIWDYGQGFSAGERAGMIETKFNLSPRLADVIASVTDRGSLLRTLTTWLDDHQANINTADVIDAARRDIHNLKRKIRVGDARSSRLNDPANRVFIGSKAGLSADPGFVYHATPFDNVPSIKSGGLRVEDSPTGPGVFLKKTPGGVGPVYTIDATGADIASPQAIIRTRQTPDMQVMDPSNPNAMLDEVVSQQDISPGQLEILMEDGQWHPVGEVSEDPRIAAQAWVDQRPHLVAQLQAAQEALKNPAEPVVMLEMPKVGFVHRFAERLPEGPIREAYQQIFSVNRAMGDVPGWHRFMDTMGPHAGDLPHAAGASPVALADLSNYLRHAMLTMGVDKGMIARILTDLTHSTDIHTDRSIINDALGMMAERGLGTARADILAYKRLDPRLASRGLLKNGEEVLSIKDPVTGEPTARPWLDNQMMHSWSLPSLSKLVAARSRLVQLEDQLAKNSREAVGFKRFAGNVSYLAYESAKNTMDFSTAVLKPSMVTGGFGARLPSLMIRTGIDMGLSNLLSGEFPHPVLEMLHALPSKLITTVFKNGKSSRVSISIPAVAARDVITGTLRDPFWKQQGIRDISQLARMDVRDVGMFMQSESMMSADSLPTATTGYIDAALRGDTKSRVEMRTLLDNMSMRYIQMMQDPKIHYMLTHTDQEMASLLDSPAGQAMISEYRSTLAGINPATGVPWTTLEFVQRMRQAVEDLTAGDPRLKSMLLTGRFHATMSPDAMLKQARGTSVEEQVFTITQRIGQLRSALDMLGGHMEISAKDSTVGNLGAIDEVRQELYDQWRQLRALQDQAELYGGGHDLHTPEGRKAFQSEMQRMLTNGELDLSRLPNEWPGYKQGNIGDASALAKFEQFLWLPERVHGFTDIMIGRGPFQHGLARMYLKRFLATGMTPEQAQVRAGIYSARRSAEFHYDITQRAPSDVQLRNVFWFNPVVRSFFKRWLIDVPSHDYLPVGWGMMLAKAGIIANFMREMNMLVQVPAGQGQTKTEIKNPMGTAFMHLMGMPQWMFDAVDPRQYFLATSTGFGVTPQPLIGVLLQLGADRNIPGLQALSHWAEPYGPGLSILPINFSYVWSGLFGPAAPSPFNWLDSNSEKQYAYDTWIEAGRLAEQQVGQPPTPQMLIKEHPGFAGKLPGTLNQAGTAAYHAQLQNWESRMMAVTHSIYRGYLLFKAIGDMSMGGPQHVQDPGKIAWDNIVYNGGKPLTTQEYDALKIKFINDHPQWAVYTVQASYLAQPTLTKTQITNSTINEYWQEVWANQRIIPTNPLQATQWMAARYTIQGAQLNLQSSLAPYSKNAYDYLTHGYQVSEATNLYHEQMYTLSQVNPVGYGFYTSNSQNWNQEYGTPMLGTDGTALLDLHTQLAALGRATALGQTSDFKTVMASINNSISQITHTPGYASNPALQGVVTWWNRVGDPYIKQTQALWNNINISKSGPRWTQDMAYAALANYENKAYYSPITVNGVKMPSPEQVLFGYLSPADQELARLKWATENPGWLTAFQRQQVTGKPTPEALTKYIAATNRYIAQDQRLVDQSGLSPTSSVVTNWMNKENAYIINTSPSQYKHLTEMMIYNTPAQSLMGTSFVRDNKPFVDAFHISEIAVNYLRSAGLSYRGDTSPTTVQVKGQVFEAYLNLMKDNPIFATLVTHLQEAVRTSKDPPGPLPLPVVFNRVFFGDYTPYNISQIDQYMQQNPQAYQSAPALRGYVAPGSAPAMAGGTYVQITPTNNKTMTWGQFAARTLRGLGAPITKANVAFMMSWAQIENTQASFNLWATEHPMTGSTYFNPNGVRNYITPLQGIQASVDTLMIRAYGYPAIVDALRNNDQQAAGAAVAASSWSSAHYNPFTVPYYQQIINNFNSYAGRMVP